MPNPIVLYDGVCGLCNRLVRFIIRRDSNAIFRFASLQGAFGAAHSGEPSHWPGQVWMRSTWSSHHNSPIQANSCSPAPTQRSSSSSNSEAL